MGCADGVIFIRRGIVMLAYYNEIDKFAAQWIRELIREGLIPDGVVDERSIEDVRPDELTGYTQCHFFAGIGGWAYALRLAGWPDDRPVWTGSCPCQPFSAAGKRKGTADERHLWPAFFWHISQQRPVTVFGEQVASKDGLSWLDTVQLDMEGAGYAVGAVDTCAAGYGAPHIRQRIYWVGDCLREGFEGYAGDGGGNARQDEAGPVTQTSSTNKLAVSAAQRLGGGSDGDSDRVCWKVQTERRGASEQLENAHGRGVVGEAGEYPSAGISECDALHMGYEVSGSTCRAMPTNGFWRNPDWLWCRDKKWRPVKSGLVPLADGVSGRVGYMRDKSLCFSQRLKGYGNAIVIPQAVEFIKAYMELENVGNS